MTAKATPTSEEKTKSQPHQPETKKPETKRPRRAGQWSSAVPPNGPIEDPPDGGKLPGDNDPY